jgi:arsenate reductase
MARFFSSEFAMKLYGIPNCSTVKKARAWLEEREIPYEFHDFKKEGVPNDLMKRCASCSAGNPSSIAAARPGASSATSARLRSTSAPAALALMQENASVIKRPILDRDGQYQVGFSEENYAAFFGE